MKIWNKICNFFSKKKEEPLSPKPNPHVQKMYDWMMGLDEDNILVIKSEYSASKYEYNTKILKTTFHVSQKNNLTGDEGCGRRIAVEKVETAFINDTTSSGFVDRTYFLAEVGKWEEELDEKSLEELNIEENNSGAIKAMFCRAKEMYREEKVEKNDKELVREIDKFMEKF